MSSKAETKAWDEHIRAVYGFPAKEAPSRLGRKHTAMMRKRWNKLRRGETHIDPPLAATIKKWERS